MVEIRSKTLQSLHTRPLQSFKIVEDLTMALHQDIQRQYQNCIVMYGDTEFFDRAIKSSMEEMEDAVKEYESKVPYHACGEGGIKIWAGTGDRVMQAALWNKVDKAGAHPSNHRVIYKQAIAQLQEELVWCEKCSVLELRACGTLFNSVPSPNSLAEELDATHLDKEDRERAESWRGGKRLTNGEDTGVGCRIASGETCGSRTEASGGSSFPTPSPEPVDQHHGGDEDGIEVLRPNEYGCYIDSDGNCCCPRRLWYTC